MSWDYHGESADKISLDWALCDAVTLEVGDDSEYVTDERGMQAIPDYIFDSLKNPKITYDDEVVSVTISDDG